MPDFHGDSAGGGKASPFWSRYLFVAFTEGAFGVCVKGGLARGGYFQGGHLQNWQR